MAEHIKVTLEHHVNRRNHAIKHGAGRRPTAVTYGKFNLRFRDPKLDGKGVRVPGYGSRNQMARQRRTFSRAIHCVAER